MVLLDVDLVAHQRCFPAHGSATLSSNRLRSGAPHPSPLHCASSSSVRGTSTSRPLASKCNLQDDRYRRCTQCKHRRALNQGIDFATDMDQDPTARDSHVLTRTASAPRNESLLCLPYLQDTFGNTSTASPLFDFPADGMKTREQPPRPPIHHHHSSNQLTRASARWRPTAPSRRG
jgi:hypothetical protein